MKTLQTRLEKMEEKYKQQAYEGVDSPLVRVIRMLIEAGKQQTAKPFEPSEEDKITHKKWRLACWKDLHYQRIQFRQLAVEDREQLNDEWSAFVTEVCGRINKYAI